MSWQEVTVEPVATRDLRPGDIVLCEIGNAQYLHIVKELRVGGCLVGNNKGHINGVALHEHIYGRLVGSLCKEPTS